MEERLSGIDGSRNLMRTSLKAPLLQVEAVGKRFPGVLALDEVSLDLNQGEVLALLGENGAGKSTLIKMLGGAHLPDCGEIRINGERVVIRSATDARAAGVAVIYQEFNLVPELTVTENIFLGRERTRFGWVDHKAERDAAIQWLARIGMEIDPATKCRDLTVAQQQVVEIARALSTNARILVMDEPSAVLTLQEVDKLFETIRDLRADGIGIIYISHRLDEIYEIADRLVVLRDGKKVGEAEVRDTSREQLIEMMVGRSLESEFPDRQPTIGEERLRVENLRYGRKVKDVSFSVRGGEVLGFSGLVGAGRTETMRLIVGAERKEGGVIFLNGEPVEIRNPGDAVANRICLLSEDRKGEGLVLQHSIVDNFGLPNLVRFSKGIVLSEKLEREEFERYSKDLNIRASGPDQKAAELSGGNQQKVVLAKWLARNADIIIIDEPTRGIDVGAKFEIYQLINRLAAEGKAIIMVSSELPEILGMSDRIIVMHEGKVKGEITDVKNSSQEDVLALAVKE